nr:MFS transporter [Allomuricauda sp.]
MKNRKTTISDTAQLSLIEKVGYGLGDMAANFYMGFFSIFLLYYYTDVWGLAPAAVGVMFLVSKIIDAVSDPGMGLIADRTQTRWGKYRPYLLYMAIPYGVLGYLVFLGPDLSDTGKLIYAYVTYILVYIAFTAINVPYSALLAVISPVAEERTKATTYRFIFAGLGSLLIAMFATPLATFFGGGDEAKGFRLTMALFATLAVIIFIIVFLTTKERIKPTVEHNSSVRSDLAALLKNTSWIALSIMSILLIVGIASRASSVVFYVKYFFGADDSPFIFIFDRIAIFTSFGLAGQIVGTLITPFLAKYFEKHHLIIGMCVLHAVVLGLGYFISVEGYWLAVAVHALGFMTLGVCLTLMFVMYTDCSEYGEWLTGKNTAGLTISSSMFAMKFGAAIGTAIPGFILAAVGFVANQEQTEGAIYGIQVMCAVLPAAAFILAAIALYFYKIDKAMLKKVESDLSERRASVGGG